MTREEIEKFSGIEPDCFETEREENWYRIGYIDGTEAVDANSDLSSLWHDASDMPEYINRRIIYYSEYFDYYGIDYPNYLIVKYGGIEMTWEASVLRNRITKWAYISDLLPKGDAV